MRRHAMRCNSHIRVFILFLGWLALASLVGCGGHSGSLEDEPLPVIPTPEASPIPTPVPSAPGKYAIAGTGTMKGQTSSVVDSDFVYIGIGELDEGVFTFTVDQQVTNPLGKSSITSGGSFDIDTGLGSQTVSGCTGEPMICAPVLARIEANDATEEYNVENIKASSDGVTISWDHRMVVDVAPFGDAVSDSSYTATRGAPISSPTPSPTPTPTPSPSPPPSGSIENPPGSYTITGTGAMTADDAATGVMINTVYTYTGSGMLEGDIFTVSLDQQMDNEMMGENHMFKELWFDITTGQGEQKITSCVGNIMICGPAIPLVDKSFEIIFEIDVSADQSEITWSDLFRLEIENFGWATSDSDFSAIQIPTGEAPDPEWYQDADGDGYGNPDAVKSAPEKPEGYVAAANGNDCDDADTSSYPGNEEVIDRKDNDCDSSVDEGFWYQDADGDGSGNAAEVKTELEKPAGYVAVADVNDCDDTDANNFPGNEEVLDEQDNNCDGNVDEDIVQKWYQDADGDGFGNISMRDDAVVQPSGYVTDNTDCDDTDKDVNPNSDEVEDEKDNNCDGMTDEGFAAQDWYKDADGDGYGNFADMQSGVVAPEGYVADDTDCNDENVDVNPGVVEMPNDTLDNNCNGEVDEPISYTLTGSGTMEGQESGAADSESTYVGANVTLAGSKFSYELTQIVESGFLPSGEATMHAEMTFTGSFDIETGDGAQTVLACTGTDVICNSVQAQLDSGDTTVAIKVDSFAIDAETGVATWNLHMVVDITGIGLADDNSSYTATPTGEVNWYEDADGDGYGKTNVVELALDAPLGYVLEKDDCDDADANNFPGNEEVQDGKDNNCDDIVDERLWYQDADGDGAGNPDVAELAVDAPADYVADNSDCNDGEANSYPGNEEVQDGVDNNCDGDIDEMLWYQDADGDGYGNPDVAELAVEAPADHIADNTDCNDDAANSYPGNEEVQDGVDNNCDGDVDEGFERDWYQDADGDGYGNLAVMQTAVEAPADYVLDSADCNDADADVNPGVAEVPDDAVDNDCDGDVDEVPLLYTIAGTGTLTPEDPEQQMFVGTDYIYTGSGALADNVFTISLDHHMDGSLGEAHMFKDVWFDMTTGEGEMTITGCTGEDAYCTAANELVGVPNDFMALDIVVSEDQAEITWNDTFGMEVPGFGPATSDSDFVATQETTGSDWYQDSDGDGYGNAEVVETAEEAPAGYVADNTDCDDADVSKYPGNTEVYDSKDNDCNGIIDDSFVAWYPDVDEDNFGDLNANAEWAAADPGGMVSDNTDCDDADANNFPGNAEAQDGKDNNCNGEIDEDVPTDWYEDADGDGYGNLAVMQSAVDAPAGYIADSADCDDADADKNPGNTEVYDGKDNDCNGIIDDSFVAWYQDSDSDGYGNAAVELWGVDAPAGYVDDNTDCDDADANSYPGNEEVQDGVDNNCNGEIDEEADPVISYTITGAGTMVGQTSTAANSTSTYAGTGTLEGALFAYQFIQSVESGGGTMHAEMTFTSSFDIETGLGAQTVSACTGASVICNSVATQIDSGESTVDIEVDSFAIDPETGVATWDLHMVVDISGLGLLDDNSSYTATPTGEENWYADADGDGFGNSAVVELAVEAPAGYVADNTDCNDADAQVNPGVAEEPDDGVDNNCNGETDEGIPSDWYEDADADGFGNAAVMQSAVEAPADYVADNTDCDDTDANNFPGNEEEQDGKDNNCDGDVDEMLWYHDADGDGFGNPDVAELAVEAPADYIADNTDCNDEEANSYPGNEEVKDGVDNNCDGFVDEGFEQDWYQDADSDGYGNLAVMQTAVDAPGDDYVLDSTDCNDADAQVNPGVAEVLDDTVDNDCDGDVDEVPLLYTVAGTGTLTPEDPAQQMFVGTDYIYTGSGALADNVFTISLDHHMDGSLGEAHMFKDVWFDMATGEGEMTITGCTGEDAYCTAANELVGVPNDFMALDIVVSEDQAEITWNDTFDMVVPGFGPATSDSDFVATQETTGSDWYEDSDGDGYGNAELVETAEEAPTGYVADNTDCDDADAQRHPGNAEVYDGKDNDCNGIIDDSFVLWYEDADSDGYGNAAFEQWAVAAPAGYVDDNTDCDDADANNFPGNAEALDGKDNNCNGEIDEDVPTDWYQDLDGDGYGNPDAMTSAVDAPTGYIADGTDCDDADADKNPGNTEVYDGKDNDCNGIIDDSFVAWYQDSDSDGYGDAAVEQWAVDAPAGYVADNTDCDDADANSYPGNEEVQDGVDNNCNGEIDEEAASVISYTITGAGTMVGQTSSAANAASTYAGTGTLEGALFAYEFIQSVESGFYEGEATMYADMTFTTSFDIETGLGSQTVIACTGEYAICNSVATQIDSGESTVDIEVDSFAIDAETGVATWNLHMVVDIAGIGLLDDNSTYTAIPGDLDWYEDADADGYGNLESMVSAAVAPAGYVTDNTDCNDADADVNPGVAEVLDDGVDNNCNGEIDEGVSSDWYEDADGDGYGNLAVMQSAVDAPAGYIADNTDCDDTDANNFPGNEEVQDGLDNNCNGDIDEEDVEYAYGITGQGTLDCRNNNLCDSIYSYAGDGNLEGDVFSYVMDQKVNNALGESHILSSAQFSLTTGLGTQTIKSCTGVPKVCNSLNDMIGTSDAVTDIEVVNVVANDVNLISWSLMFEMDTGGITGMADSESHYTATTSPPSVARAGVDQTLKAGNTVNLNGSASKGSLNSQIVSYQWSIISKPAGSMAQLDDASIVSPSFLGDVEGSYVITLIVTDVDGKESLPDYVVISITAKIGCAYNPNADFDMLLMLLIACMIFYGRAALVARKQEAR